MPLKTGQSPEFSPPVDWSDMMLYMVSTPSPHTKESIKATLQAMISNLENNNNYYNNIIILIQAWKGMLDGESFLKAGWIHGLKLH